MPNTLWATGFGLQFQIILLQSLETICVILVWLQNCRCAGVGSGVSFYDLDVCSLIINSHRKLCPEGLLLSIVTFSMGKNLHTSWLLFLSLHVPELCSHFQMKGQSTILLRCPSLLSKTFFHLSENGSLSYVSTNLAFYAFNKQIINVSVIYMKPCLLLCVDENTFLFVCLADHFMQIFQR